MWHRYSSDADAESKIRVILKLLDKGANINSIDDRGQTLLHKTINSAADSLLLTMLQNKADPNAIDHLGYAPIYYAGLNLRESIHSRFDVVMLSLKNKADPNAIERRQRLRAIELLIEFGADPNFVNMKGDNALHLIFRSGNDSFSSLHFKIYRGTFPSSSSLLDHVTSISDSSKQLLDTLTKGGLSLIQPNYEGQIPLSFNDPYFTRPDDIIANGHRSFPQ